MRRTRTRPEEPLKLLPNTMQLEEVVVTAEMASIPDELVHKVRFEVTGDLGKVLFDKTLPAYEVSSRQIELTYEPETVEDQEAMNTRGGMYFTPSYLFRLRPVLEVAGERLAVGVDGAPMGGALGLTVELISDRGRFLASSQALAGNLLVMGIVAGKVVMPEEMPADEKNGERLLHEEALRYTARWAAAEEELGELLGLPVLRPTPSVVTLGGVIEVTYVLSSPVRNTWKGVFVDAGHRAVEAVGPKDATLAFMRLSSLEGSALEERVLEDDFQVESMSTSRLLGLASMNAGADPLDRRDQRGVLVRSRPSRPRSGKTS